MAKNPEYTQGEYVFSIRPFEAFKSMRVLGELQKVIGPAIGGAVKGAAGDGVPVSEAISSALTQIAQTVDGDTLEKAVRLLLDADYVAVKKQGGSYVRLDEGALNEVFEGRPFDMLVLCGKIFEVNYLDFSKLSSVPAGFRQALREIKRGFQDISPRILDGASISTEPLTAE